MTFSFARWASLLSITSFVCAEKPLPNDVLSVIQNKGTCCAGLNHFLPGKVSFSNDTVYENSKSSYWSNQEQTLAPTCIVIPTTANDVSTVVYILQLGYRASVPSCQFAVRGGGHTPHAGSANINNGVTIDLQSLNSVSLSSDRQSVIIGSGNRWGNVYGALDPQDLTIIGGRVSTVGAGGLLTGGGVSFLSGRYGFACNNIISYEVVLGNGTIVTANSTENPSLYRALKGGSNNFGIVTAFTANVYSQTPFWGGEIIQAPTEKDAYFDFLANFTQSANYDPYAAIISSFVWAGGAPYAIIHYTTYTNGDVAWPPTSLAPLDAIPKLQSDIRKGKMSNFTDQLAAESAQQNNAQNAFVTFSFVNDPKVSAAFMEQVYQRTQTTALDLAQVVGISLVATLQPLPYILYSRDSSSNVLGFGRFSEDLINVLFVVSWTLATDNDQVYKRLQDLENELVALSSRMGVQNEWEYLNYAAQWQAPIVGYGDAEVAFLRRVSRIYDPDAIFQKAVPGGFKLSL